MALDIAEVRMLNLGNRLYYGDAHSYFSTTESKLATLSFGITSFLL